jgi:hypothetical protein
MGAFLAGRPALAGLPNLVHQGIKIATSRPQPEIA